MKKMGYACIVEMAWTLVKGGTSLYNLSCRKESQPITTIRHVGGWNILLFSPSLNQRLTSSYHHDLQTYPIGTLILAWGLFSKTSLPIWLISVRWSRMRLLSHSTLIYVLNNSIFNGRSVLNSANLPPKIKWFKSMWVIKHTQSSSL